MMSDNQITKGLAVSILGLSARMISLLCKPSCHPVNMHYIEISQSTTSSSRDLNAVNGWCQLSVRKEQSVVTNYACQMGFIDP